VTRITAWVLTRILRHRISRKPCLPIRRDEQVKLGTHLALESRDPTGNLVGGLVAAALGGQLFEPLELMARAVGDVALLGGAVPHGAQAVNLSPVAPQPFSALPATNGALNPTAGAAVESQSGGSRAEGPLNSSGDGLAIGLSPFGLSDDPFWVGTTPFDLSGQVPASAPMGVADANPWVGPGIGVPSGLANIAGTLGGTTDGIGTLSGNSSGDNSLGPPASGPTASGTPSGRLSATPTTGTAAVLSPTSSAPSAVSETSSGVVQPATLPTMRVSGDDATATPTGTGVSASAVQSAPLLVPNPTSDPGTLASDGATAPIAPSTAPATPPPPPVAPSLVTGSDAGGTATVKVLDPATGQVKLSFAPYGNNFTGGARVAAADLNADGVADVITGPGHGGGSQIKVFDGTTGRPLKGTLGSFNAFAAGATDGVFVAAGDVNGDGTPDIVVGTDQSSSPSIRIFDGHSGAPLDTVQLSPDFAGGVRVAAGDVNGDGKADIIAAAGPGGPPQVAVFDGTNLKQVYSFFAFDPISTDGVYVASGDVNADGRADIIAGRGGGAPQVAAFSGADLSTRLNFLAFDSSFTGGVRVGVTDAEGDGRPEIVAAAGPGDGAVRLFDLTGTQVRSTAPYGAAFHDGAFAAGTASVGGGVMPLDVKPILTIETADGGVMEGGSVTFTVTRSGNPDTAFSYSFALGGPATDRANYPPPQSRDLAAGQTTDSFVINITDDMVVEDPETLTVNLAGPTFVYDLGTPSSASVTVFDNDGPINIVPVAGLANTGGGCADCIPIIPGMVWSGPYIDTGNGPPGVAVTLPASTNDPPGVAIAYDAFVSGGITASTGTTCVSFCSSPLSSGNARSQGPTITWDNDSGLGSSGVFGNGMIPSNTPYLRQAGTNSIAAISGGNARYFYGSGSTYTARYFVQDRFAYDSGAGEYTLTDTAGERWVFYDFNASLPAAQRGQLKRLLDPEGNQTNYTYNASGQLTQMQRSATVGAVTTTETFLYAYIASGANAGKVSTVTLQRQVGGGLPQTVRSEAYAYYDGTTSNGNLGDLKTAQLKDADGNMLDTQYFRYYTSNSSTGYQGGLKYALGPDSYARLVGAFPNPDSATDTQVAPYADRYLEYDSAHRVTKSVVQGTGCSVCAGGLGTYTYSYTPSAFAPGYGNWQTKTVVTLPDQNTRTVYTNFAGETLLSVYQDATTLQQWMTFYKYDSQGREILEAAPSAISGFDENRPDLLNNQAGNYTYLYENTGLIATATYYTSTTAGDTTPGGVAGYVNQTSLQRGEVGTSVLQSTTQYFHHTVNGVTVNPVATQTVYRLTNGTGAETTSYAYTWFTGTTQMQSATVTYPIIGTTQNGPGGTTGDQETVVFDAYGRPVWTKDADGFINYTQYDPGTGAVVKTVTDVDTSLTGEFTEAPPTGWTTPPGGGLALITRYEVDSLGRTTKMTDPAGNVTYTVYDDTNYEVRVYRGWSGTTPTGPTQVYRHDRDGNYYEALTMTATPTVSGGRPTGTEAISGIQTLTRSAMNLAGQLTDAYDYFNLSGLSYSTVLLVLAGATELTNYAHTQYRYDQRGWLNRTQTPTNTIYRTVRDGLGRVVSEWVGTNDTPTSGFWSPSNPAGMTAVRFYSYDEPTNGVGDSNLTRVTERPDPDPNHTATDRVTQYFYDWRDRQVASKSGVQATEDTTTHRPISYSVYDNLGEVTTAQVYDGDGVTLVDTTPSDGVPDAPAQSRLRAQTDIAYDDRGRVYQTNVHSVDPTSGGMSSATLATNTWFDHRGNVAKTSQPGGVVTKSVYDGAGRQKVQYTTDGGGDTTWADALNVTGDNVLQQTETTYDADGNSILVTTRERFHDETATGTLVSPTTAPKARVSYQAMYYDRANRLIHSVDVGTNGGAGYTRPSTAPTSSDTVLVTDYGYNAAGWQETVTDPKGLVSKTFYDNLGRVTKQVEDYTNGVVTDTTNKTVEYTYDNAGHTLTVKADLVGGHQTTQYIYGASTGTNDLITSNDILKQVRYPDKSSGDPSASTSDQETYTVNALGQNLTFKDRSNTTHTYTYDVLGRQTSDAVTLGAGVDGSVQRIETAYDTQGNPYLTTSYDAAVGGNVVNQVQQTFNGLGQLTANYQSHSGVVNTGTTPKVQYAYTEMAGPVNNSRPTSMTYPNGLKVLNYNYSSGLNDTISRLSSLSDTSGTLESYDYLGLGTVVRRSHPQPGVDQTYIKNRSFTDDFNRANGSLGANWLNEIDGFQVSGNKALATGASGGLAVYTGAVLADTDVSADITLPAAGSVGELLARYSGTGSGTSWYLATLTYINATDYRINLYVNVNGTATALPGQVADVIPSGANTLRLVVQGSQQKVYYNGALVLSATDTQVTAPGLAGLASNANVSFDNFSVNIPSPPAPFTDNFNRADSGNLGANWLTEMGTVQVSSNKAVGTATSSGNLAVYTGLTPADVDVSADITLAGGGNTIGGVVARYTGTGVGNGWYLGSLQYMSPTHYTATIDAIINGSTIVLATVDVTPAGANTLRLVVQGNQLALYFNGALILSATDTQVSGPGMAGIYGGAATSGNFSADNFSATPLPPPTSFTDGFNRANSGDLGANWLTEVGTFQVSGNKALATGGSNVAVYTGATLADTDVSADITLAGAGSVGELVARYSGTAGGPNKYLVTLSYVDATHYAVNLYVTANNTTTPLGTQVSVTPAGANTLRLVVQGSQLQVYFNGILKITATDAQVTSPGLAGITATPNVAFDNFNVAPLPPPAPFTDDFNRANSGNLGANWLTELGTMQVSGNKALVTGTGAAVAVYAGAALADLDISADITVAGANTGGELLARYSGTGSGTSWYKASLIYDTPTNDKVYLYAWANGALTTLFSGNVTPAGANTLRLVVQGSQLQVYFNGALVGSVTDARITAPGLAGLTGTPNVAFDNFSVSPVAPKVGELNGDAGDQYVGLDRFGRVVDQRWVQTGTRDVTDRFVYGYDRDSNRTYRDNRANPAFGEVYTYDGLNQLATFQRGTLTAAKTGVLGTASRSQNWAFDALGNWNSVTSDVTTQTRTHDRQNEITSVSGATTPTYDADGNLTTDETGKHFVYDAWNRLVTVKDSSNNVIASYKYDGLGRRVSETKSGTTRDFYYSNQWQVLEERVSAVARVQYVWSPVYVDALVLHDRDADSNGSLEERLWAQQDANFNVTALVNGSGTVVERFAYDPYGTATVYDANWIVRTGGSAFGWQYLHQGLRYDKDTGLYEVRHRFYSPTLGRWIQLDPITFESGELNHYYYERNRPTVWTDPTGEKPIYQGPWGFLELPDHRVDPDRYDLGGLKPPGTRRCPGDRTIVIIAAYESYPGERDNWLTMAREKYGKLTPIWSNVSTVRELQDILRQYPKNCFTNIVIGGHGSPGVLWLGGLGSEYGMVNLKWLTKCEGLIATIRDVTDPNGLIELQGCNTADLDALQPIADLLHRPVCGIEGQCGVWLSPHQMTLTCPSFPFLLMGSIGSPVCAASRAKPRPVPCVLITGPAYTHGK
jgi:RHS repeat-associated protein